MLVHRELVEQEPVDSSRTVVGRGGRVGDVEAVQRGPVVVFDHPELLLVERLEVDELLRGYVEVLRRGVDRLGRRYEIAELDGTTNFALGQGHDMGIGGRRLRPTRLEFLADRMGARSHVSYAKTAARCYHRERLAWITDTVVIRVDVDSRSTWRDEPIVVDPILIHVDEEATRKLDAWLGRWSMEESGRAILRVRHGAPPADARVLDIEDGRLEVRA